MITQDFTTSFLVDNTPEEVYNAIRNMRGWWSEEIAGSTENEGDELLYHYKDVHACKVKLVKAVPGKKLEWLVLENHFSFTQDKAEWKGTKLSFDIAGQDGQTVLRFTHEGLVPQYECYEICREAWGNYINSSLHDLITTGIGQPNPKEGEGFNARITEKWNLQS